MNNRRMNSNALTPNSLICGGGYYCAILYEFDREAAVAVDEVF